MLDGGEGGRVVSGELGKKGRESNNKNIICFKMPKWNLITVYVN